MTSHVAQWSDQVEPQTCAHASRVQLAVHVDVFVDWLVSCLFDHAMEVEKSSSMKWVVFGFSQILFSTLQSHPEALKSVGLILLSKMSQALFFPHAHLTRKCLNRVGVSSYSCGLEQLCYNTIVKIPFSTFI